MSAMGRSEALRRRRQLAAIHIASRDLGLDESAYCAMLLSVVGVPSAKDLDDEGRRRVLDHLRDLGWQPKRPDPHRPRNLHVQDVRGRLLGKIEAFLSEAGRPWKYARTILMRQGGPDRLEWAQPHHLSAVIAALDRDAKRHGRRRR